MRFRRINTRRMDHEQLSYPLAERPHNFLPLGQKIKRVSPYPVQNLPESYCSEAALSARK